VNANRLATAMWFKSSRSNGQNACVEVAYLEDEAVAVRDTKDDGRGPVMVFTAAQWGAFLDGVRDGRFE
jgi:hypothetical protein